MAITLDSISTAKAQRAPRIVLLGTEKVGKSTFAAASNKPVFIPVRGEDGIDAIDVPHFPTATSFGELIDMIGVLYSDDHDYETVVIDSASTLEPLVWKAVCDQEKVDVIEKACGGYGRGISIGAVRLWRELMDGLDALRDTKDMACIIIGHVKTKTFSDPTTDSYDQYQFDVHQAAGEAMFRWCDSILFAHRKAYVKKEDAGFGKTNKKAAGDDSRMLYTQKRPAHPGGGRGVYGRLPYELPLDWEAFSNAIEHASN